MTDHCEHRNLRCLWEVASHPMAQRTWEASVRFRCRDCGHPFEPTLELLLFPMAEQQEPNKG